MQYRELTEAERAESRARYEAQQAAAAELQRQRAARGVELAAGIAAALGGARQEPSDENAGRYETISLPASHDNPGGAAVLLSFAADRIEVRGHWPADPDDERSQTHPAHARRIYPRDIGAIPYHEPHEPRISIAASKSAQTIARDIQRRYLPAYLPLYAKCCAAAERRSTAIDQREQTHRTLLDAEPGAQRHAYQSRDTVTGKYHDASRWEVQTDHQGGIYTLRFNDLPLDLTLELIALYVAQIDAE